MSTEDYFLISTGKKFSLSSYRINICVSRYFIFFVDLVRYQGMRNTLEAFESASMNSLMPCRVGYGDTDSASNSVSTFGFLACT